ncbi:DUF4955 domain-containing protein [Pelagicoccus sp. NFK12]|uniref:DUF4955 domain-containing protein n=1 Tax=Pelagicoccus enzymogenes TaxID=2773457 RepID=A0A927IHR8_9BACT|nr:DUF4955 domain-containing protein [Pelagicoccus enzymogenes]MBD5780089.1 DUF4955 domain-containing protein [Pelagicoccus enzymogenes]
MLRSEELIEAPSWVEFNQNAQAGTPWQSSLRDFSYAGYRFSNAPLPQLDDWQSIDVTDYGAIPDDGLFDDTAIRAAIEAAESSNGPVVIDFPAGRFLVADEANAKSPIEVNRGYIVFRGVGAHDNGTEIFADWSGGENDEGVPTDGGPWRFIFRPENRTTETITILIEGVRKGERVVTVDDASQLTPGDSVDLVYNDSQSREANFPGLEFNSAWNSSNKGIRSFEKHIISRVIGNQVVFENPVQLNIELDTGYARLETHPHISEVGIIGIRFSSDWANHPDTFSHHKNAVVDYAWNAVLFENVRDSWIRDTEFRDWNQGLAIDRSIAITVKDVEFSGKPGHSSYYARYSYGTLFENCLNTASHWHAAGMRWSTTSTVFKNCTLGEKSVDCHGYHPYANLLDNVTKGNFTRNGGAKSAYPNSGPDLTFWNFEKAGETRSNYDFWNPTQQPLYTYARPLFIGFSSPGKTVGFANEGLDELREQQPYPQSLFEAQLQMRRYGAYHSASSFVSNHPPVHANNLNPSVYWESSHAGLGQWIMTDLGTPYEVLGVYLAFEEMNIEKLRVEIWDDSSWQKAWEGEVSEQEALQLYFDSKANTRKLRMTVTSMKQGHESEPLRIRSFKALQHLDTSSSSEINFSRQGNGNTTWSLIVREGSDPAIYAPSVFESKDLRGWIELNPEATFDLDTNSWTLPIARPVEATFWRGNRNPGN